MEMERTIPSAEQIDAVKARVDEAHVLLNAIRKEMRKIIFGQEYLLDRLFIGLLCNQHILIEGVPGLAKTLSVTTLARTLSADFHRIQFTPDLLPADLIGTLIYNPKNADFFPKKGPIFANIILADEINRAPAKVQSALLEAMQERQVTIGDVSYPLDDPFLVLATQNPIEQGGTYPLPEAQVDRFMLKLKVDYPTKKEELHILQTMAKATIDLSVQPVTDLDEVKKMRSITDSIYLDEKIETYIVNLVDATRNPDQYGLDIERLIRYGASPRATIYLALTSKAYALLQGRAYVVPQDVKTIAPDVLRHRIIISYEAEAEERGTEDIIEEILGSLDVP
jgi:MoxR-like ATPase